MKMFSLALLLLLGSFDCRADQLGTLPARPEYGVADPSSLLSPGIRRALEQVLVSHDRLTGEQIVLAIFEKNPESGEPRSFAEQLFKSWEVGRRSERNGALLAYFVKERELALIPTYALASRFPDSKEKQLRNSVIRPELAAKHVDRAFALSIFDLLTTLESPLIQTGEALATLKEGGFEGDFTPRAPIDWSSLWWIWIALGIALSFGAVMLLTSAEAHYTSSGWFKCSPVRPERFKCKALEGFSGGGTLGQW